MKRLATAVILVLGAISLGTVSPALAATPDGEKAVAELRPLPAAYPWINFR
ncbi:MAG: hypothetical protein RLO50_07825 [Azospirillaceae bacterium]